MALLCTSSDNAIPKAHIFWSWAKRGKGHASAAPVVVLDGKREMEAAPASRFRFDALKGNPIAGGNNRTRRVVGGERAGEISGVIVASSHPRHRGRSPPVPAVPSPLLVQRGEVKGGGACI